MRTPVVMIIGIVLAPCGLLLDLVCTVASGWRGVSSITGGSLDEVHHQGIWDICKELQSVNTLTCGLTDNNYFQNAVIQVARGLMLASLCVGALGIVLASIGVRCWQETPNYLFSGLGGIVIFISGVLSLIPQSWYTSQIQQIVAPGTDIQAGYALVLGIIGSCMEIIGGFSLILSFSHFCTERQKSTTSKYYSKNMNYYNRKTTPRSYNNPIEVTDGPPSVAPSTAPCDSDL